MALNPSEAPVRVLAFTDYYLPGYRGGGPVKSMYNMAQQLAPAVQFSIVTQDRDLGDSSPYTGIPFDQWVELGQSRIFYLSATRNRLIALRQILQDTEYDVVYLSSFFSAVSTLPVLLLRFLGLIPRRPVILAVRGEFSPAALKLKAHKKALYLQVARRTGLLKQILFQATSTEEAADIRKILGDQIALTVVPNLAGTPAILRPADRPPGPLRVVFLSRVVPMKNLKFALEALEGVTEPLEFTIYGPLEDTAYWQTCEEVRQRLPEHIQVRYAGSVAPPQVPQVLAEHDLLFLPTQGENFGHAIVEALGAGCPVLISDRTPWQDLEAQGCGWALPLETPAAFTHKLNELARLATDEAEQLTPLSQRAVAYARRLASNPALLEKTQQMFGWNRA